MTVMTITEKAKEKVQELCAKNGKYAVRLGLKGGGCAGFSYDWGFAEQSEVVEEDELIKCNEGNLVIDSASAFYLFGTELDYIEEVFGSRFDIKNPNTKSACGCGESVNFDMRV
tara:strand:+ start:43 stop:384 length:342 start_codon:yes stop_codon:yes gene_type:complete